MQKRILVFLFSFILPIVAAAQTAVVKGVVTDANENPLPGATVSLKGTSFSMVTDESGAFSFSNVPYGVYSIEFSGDNINPVSKPVDVNSPAVEFGKIKTESNALQSGSDQENIPTITLSDDDMKESESKNVASSLNASRDAFTAAASFSFSIARFRIRGYDNGNEILLMNGAPMNDLANGRIMYNTFSGLNDVMRSRENYMGLSPATFSYGSLGGASIIDSRASHQRKQLQVSFAASNRAYDNRVVATYGSGILKDGWSFALSYTRRWADEGFIEGTFYDGHSYFASVEKFINDKHSLSLTAFGAATKNGRSSASTQEMYDLAGSNYYNPTWGYQNGKKRNASVGDNHQPVAILTHEWTINEKSSLESAVSFLSGMNRVSGLDWYSATDPRPDYYRKLPSYVLSSTQDSVLFYQTSALLSTDENMRQINWDAMYEANRNTGDTAKYVVSERVTENKMFSFNTFYNNSINDYLTIYGGLMVQSQTSEYYKELKDLLGGQYFVNLNQFADQTVEGNNQHDLNNPNRKIRVGDKYGYHYAANINYVSVWQQSAFKFTKVDAFYALQLSNTGYYRTGKVRNGIFADKSFGDSKKENFFNYAVKAGATYKLNGRNYFFLNAAMMTRPPLFENAFISPSTQNTYANSLYDERINSMEYGYLFKSPRFKARAVGYLTEFQDGMDVFRLYDDDYKTFVNYSIVHIDKRHVGVELSAEANLGQGFSATAVAATGQYFYTDRQTATITKDNSDSLLLANATIYSTNMHVGGTPESAYTLGLSYRSKHFWFVYVNANWFDDIYIAFNPVRRTLSGIEQMDVNTAQRNDVLSQTQVPGQFTLDVSGGWSWKLNNKIKSLKKNTFLVLNVGVNNLLDNTSFITNGYEQLRFDFQDKSIGKFAPKYYYAFGATFFVNLTLRMN